MIATEKLFLRTAQMDQAEVLEQIATWLREEGLAPDASPEAQLCLLWRAQQRTRSRLSSVTKDLERHRSQHLAEMAEVRKSLEQIRIFTEHKDVLAQEIQDENDKLREQLRRIITLQDAQISEVAKMLYQQGLTELIHSSPSEQVAYLLVERASLLESTEHPDKPTGDGDPESLLGTEAQASDTSVCQSTHKRAPRHLQSAWKRLLGFHKTSQSRHAFIPAEARPLTGHGSSLQKECSRLERDLEEGSRRLAMAHNEIRRLTDELESAHLTRRAYEPELQSAQEEVVQLRQEVEKLKRYEMAELRKAKELNDRLDLEIRALRTRVRSLDAEKSSLQQTVVSLQVEVERVESVQVEVDHATKVAEVESLQKKTEQLESALQEQQQRLLTAQLQANQANEFVKTQSAELAQSNEISINLQEKLTAQMQHLMETQETVKFLQKEVEQLELSLLQQQQQQQLGTVHVRADHAFDSTKECPDCHQALKTKLLTQNNWETVKKEICETLKCLDKERGKYHNMKEKHKEKLSRAKQKFDDETTWRDERIKSLERELSLCSHSLAKGEVFRDGKQEIGQQGFAHVQTNIYPGAQLAKHAVATLC
ncbi:uncharacterized protein [Leuresthes tenuis]|uniref:uncharacterized protein isoform X2 n=1 Tax=Leuresthes tenuis TaxID=355514 RepID=UPI003B500100